MKTKLFFKVFKTTTFLILLSFIALFFIQNYVVNQFYINSKSNNLEKHLIRTASEMSRYYRPDTYSQSIKKSVEKSNFFNRTDVQLYSIEWEAEFNWINDKLMSKLYIESDDQFYIINYDKYTNAIYSIDLILDTYDILPLISNKESKQFNLSHLFDSKAKYNIFNSKSKYNISNSNHLYLVNNNATIFIKDIHEHDEVTNNSIYNFNHQFNFPNNYPIDYINNKIKNIKGNIIGYEYNDSINLGYSYISKFMNETLNSFKVTNKPFDQSKLTKISEIDNYTSIPYTILIYPLKINKETYYLTYFTTYDNLNFFNPLDIQNVWFMISMLFVSSLLSYTYSLIVTKPILKIKTVTEQLSNLDFSKKCVVNTNDEIQELAEDINKMATQLEINTVDLNNKIKKMHEVESFRKLFIVAASHEFRTPLTIMRGIVEGYQDGVFKYNELQPIKNIEFEIINLENIVNELITISKNEANSMSYNYTFFQLSDLVQVNLNRYKYILNDRNIRTSVTLEDGFIHADEEKISLVIKNVLSNSIKYSKQNTTIIVEVIETESKMAFSVENIGEKLNPNTIKMLWEPFYRDHNNKNKIHGFGIGLYTTKLILSAHNSNYNLTNTEQGVKFYSDFDKISE